jgi:hypothetical protein
MSLIKRIRKYRNNFRPKPGSVISRLYKNDIVLSGLISLAAFLVLLGVLEIGFRLFMPFGATQWPSRFSPDAGFLFEPNALVKHTNYLDFWTVEKTNSLGFLDAEPPASTQNQCHVTFIGDSFVEAAQVNIPSKVQRIVERTAATRHPGWRLSTSAFGYSGTGQLNQIPFYDRYARRLAPKLVVLVFVTNDFSNNSAILESLRNGWHPEHLPRVFAKRVDGEFRLTDIDPNWQSSRLQPITTSGRLAWLHSRLKGHSLLYRWVWLKLSLLYPSLQSLEGASLADQILDRSRRLRAALIDKRQLNGWDDNYATDLDRPFHEEHLSPLYAEAVQATRFALQEFRRRAEADGGKLIVLAASQLTSSAESGGKANYAMRRLRDITAQLGIPLLDQYQFILKQGGDPSAAGFRHDSHWSEKGHAWAAEMVMQYLEQNVYICK